MEFIDMEHTPKNILIRAVRESNPQKRVTNVGKMAQFLGVENTLQKLLKAEPTIDTGKM